MKQKISVVSDATPSQHIVLFSMATKEGEGKRLEASHVFIGGKRHRLGLHAVRSKRGVDWRLAQYDEIDQLLIEEVNAVASFVQPVFQEKDEVSCVMVTTFITSVATYYKLLFYLNFIFDCYGF